MKRVIFACVLATLKGSEADENKITSLEVTNEDSYELLNDFPLFDKPLQTKVRPGYTYGGNAFIDINDPNYMFLIKDAEASTSEIYHVPLLRDAANGQITGLDFTSTIWVDTNQSVNNYTRRAPALVSEPYITQISTTVDPNGKWWYSTVCGSASSGNCADGRDYYEPQKNCYGTYDAASDSFTTDGCIDDDTWTALGLNYAYPESVTAPFTGFYGMNFTADGTIFGTAPYGLFEATMDWATYTPQSVVQRCELLNITYLGSLAHIPSGTYKDDVMIANFDDSEVSILEMNTATRECRVDATSGEPLMKPLVDGLTDAWGIWFDPYTNNFMASSWYDSFSDYVYQFKGFVPGINQGNINDALHANGDKILAATGQSRKRGRRKLSKSSKSTKSGGSLTLEKVLKEIDKEAGKDGFADAVDDAATFLEESQEYKNCLDFGENDPDSIAAYIEMADEILDALDEAHEEIREKYPDGDFTAIFAEQTALFTELRNACTGQVVAGEVA